MISYKYGEYTKKGTIKLCDDEISSEGFSFYGECLCILDDGKMVGFYCDEADLETVTCSTIYQGEDIVVTKYPNIHIDLPMDYDVDIPVCLLNGDEVGLFDPVHADGAPAYFSYDAKVYRYGADIGNGKIQGYRRKPLSWWSPNSDSVVDGLYMEGIGQAYLESYNLERTTMRRTVLRGYTVRMSGLANVEVLAPPDSRVIIPHDLLHWWRTWSRKDKIVYVPVKTTGERLYILPGEEDRKISIVEEQSVPEEENLVSKKQFDVTEELQRLLSDVKYRKRFDKAMKGVYDKLPESSKSSNEVLLSMVQIVERLL